MGSAIVGGLIASGFMKAGDCTVVEKVPEARAALEKRFPGVLTSAQIVAGESGVLAVKPSDLEALCADIEPGSYQRVLSIVAGASTSRIGSLLWPGAPVVRAMPNMPALVGAGASAIAAGAHASEEDLVWAEGVLSSVGVVVRLSEKLLDAVTGLSGSGPAYIFLLAEAMIEAGVLQGLDREVSRILTVQTLLGAARMLAETGGSAEEMRSAVTSPGGTTAAGLRELERHGLRAAILDAVSSATDRSRELNSGR